MGVVSSLKSIKSIGGDSKYLSYWIFRESGYNVESDFGESIYISTFSYSVKSI